MEPIGFDKKKANEVMAKKGLDMMVLTSPENVFYTSGLPVRHIEYNPILYVLANQYPTISVIRRDGEDSVITWALFDQELTWIRDFAGIMSKDDALSTLAAMVGQEKAAGKKIGIEEKMPFYIYDRLKRECSGATFEQADGAIMELRSVKTAEEIRRIREATRISEKVISAMTENLREGITDLELIKLAKLTTLNEGGIGTNHLTMSLGDSDPEAPGTGRKIKKGEMTRFDTGAVYKGYVSDVSRHACLGPVPADAKKMVEYIVDLQQTCIDAIKPGVTAGHIEEIIGKRMEQNPVDFPVFAMGHGVGLNTEESHFIPASIWNTSDMVFKEGMIFDLEFWSPYEPYNNRLIGMEDTYLLKRNGCERITKLDRVIFSR
ncbi:MAG: Xaa-Pro peptidase family protein [Candidatus Thermoplasmatota archaeon]|nr:Xaa-Pro peptidase family protein [Candidatus Thermoplasmatota archaeon]